MSSIAALMDVIKTMRTVFFVTNNYRPHAGGVVNSIDVVEKYLRTSYKIYIITLDFTGNHTDDPEHIIRIPHLLHFTLKSNPMAIAFRPKRYVENLIQQLKPDIIHVHHPFYLGSIGAKLANNYNIPCIFTYHTQYEEYAHYIPFVPISISRVLIKYIVRRFCKKICAIIAPTISIAQLLTEREIKTPVHIVPSAIDERFFFYTPRTLSKPIKLLCVSRFVPEKNLFFLLRMFKLLESDNYTLTLAGFGFLLPALKRYALQELNLSPDSVQFIERPSKDMLMHLYQQAHFFVFASKTETQGLVLAEAMATGLPVVALKAPAVQDIVEHTNNGFLVENEVEMAQIITRLSSCETEYILLQQNAFLSAQHFAPHNIQNSITTLYESLLL